MKLLIYFPSLSVLFPKKLLGEMVILGLIKIFIIEEPCKLCPCSFSFLFSLSFSFSLPFSISFSLFSLLSLFLLNIKQL